MIIRKLRGYVLPTIYVMTMAALFMGISFFSTNLFKKSENYSFSINPVSNATLPVVSTEKAVQIIKPIKENAAQITNYYYDRSEDDLTQQKSLIYYENTYMQNTGILYSSDTKFEVLAVLDGTVKEVKKDNILGNVVIVEHDGDIRTNYYCVEEVNYKAGDKVKQGDIIALGGQSKLETGKENNLLFEVYIKGNLTNPEDFYSMNINDLKQ